MVLLVFLRRGRRRFSNFKILNQIQPGLPLTLPRIESQIRLRFLSALSLSNGGCYIKSESLSQKSQKYSTNQSIQEKKKRRSEILIILSLITKIYDALTLPIYKIIQKPEEKLAKHNAIKAECIDKKKMIFKGLTPVSPFHKELNEISVNTMDELFSHAVKKHKTRACLGTRELLGVEEIARNPGQDGIVAIKKYFTLSDIYTWKNYLEIEEIVNNLRDNFIKILKLKPKDKVAIFAETREEWLLIAFAAFRCNLTVVTVFITLGMQGIHHSLEETKPKCLFTSEDLLSRSTELTKDLPFIQNIVYFNKPQKLSNVNIKQTERPKIYKYSDFIKSSGDGDIKNVLTQEEISMLKPLKNDHAMILYTSGSSGNPKGVILSHLNIISGLKSLADVFHEYDDPNERDIHIGYLPLAHVLELISESMCMIQGIRIGYSSILTLTDRSEAIKPGSKGDASILKPTIITAVPLVLERISNGIKAKISEQSPAAQLIFNYFFDYKIKWVKKGYDTPITNYVFFSKIRKLVGGKIRFMTVGGAPLSSITHQYIRNILCCPVVNGYGLTESSAAATLSYASDLQTGRIGPPLHCCNLRLVDWEEGNYKTTDKPNPRGELLIGGDNVAVGYYKKRESLDFFEEDGIRWIRTGDIAEVHQDGCFKIIDRKKDLVKISNGEYLSLGKIEADLKSSPIIENICIVAHPEKDFVIAIIVPNKIYTDKLFEEELVKLNKKVEYLNGSENSNLLNQIVLKKIQDHCQKLKMNKYEIPQQVYICNGIWTPQTGLVTASFKIKRNNIIKRFENEINQMFS